MGGNSCSYFRRNQIVEITDDNLTVSCCLPVLSFDEYIQTDCIKILNSIKGSNVRIIIDIRDEMV